MTVANIDPAFSADGYTDYTVGEVSPVSGTEYAVPTLKPNDEELPTDTESADYAGTDPVKKAAAEIIIIAKAQAWFDRNENERGVALRKYANGIGAKAPGIIGARYMGDKYDGRDGTGGTTHYDAGIKIFARGNIVDPDGDWYEPQGVKLTGPIVFVFLNSGDAARSQIVGRHEVGHASDHVSFGDGDHSVEGLMTPDGSTNTFSDESILRLRGWSP